MKIETMKIGAILAGFIAQARGRPAISNGHETMLAHSRGPNVAEADRGRISNASRTLNPNHLT